MKIAIIGTGYVGLVTGTCFAETGVTVSCTDIDKEKIKILSNGRATIYEPGLEPLMKRNIEKGRLIFTADTQECVEGAEAIFISVGTPPDEDGSADLSHVLKVASEIGKVITSYVIIVIKSTVPVGTSEKVRKAVEQELRNRNVTIPFDMASNPEFLKEGSAVEDFLKPERIIIGTSNEKAAEIMSRLYKPFVLNNHPIFYMDIASAELTKYAANAMLATRISFINEIANLCELLGADINQVRKGIGSDSRIGSKFLYPGPGYGGSCFPKDIKALQRTAQEHGYDMKVINAVEEANKYQKNVVFNKIMKYFNNNLKNKKITVWGLSFKPHTDDIRESSAIHLIKRLLDEKATISVYDPAAMKETEKVFGNKIHYASNQYTAVESADALAIVTEWPEFRIPDLEKMSKLMRNKVIFDARNIYEPVQIREAGFQYYGIGRK